LKKEQLERIVNKIIEIDQIIKEDKVGSETINGALSPFQDAVKAELKSIVWSEYVDSKKPPGTSETTPPQ